MLVCCRRVSIYTFDENAEVELMLVSGLVIVLLIGLLLIVVIKEPSRVGRT